MDAAANARRGRFPGPFLLGGFPSLLGGFNSLFGRLGNLPFDWRIMSQFGPENGPQSSFCQFLPVDQGRAAELGYRYWTASPRRTI